MTVINETMAHRFWPGADPLGMRFGSGSRWFTIVGIVGDVKFTSLTKDADPEFYEPYRQSPVAEMILTVRTASADESDGATVAILPPTMPMSITPRSPAAGSSTSPPATTRSNFMVYPSSTEN